MTWDECERDVPTTGPKNDQRFLKFQTGNMYKLKPYDVCGQNSKTKPTEHGKQEKGQKPDELP